MSAPILSEHCAALRSEQTLQQEAWTGRKKVPSAHSARGPRKGSPHKAPECWDPQPSFTNLECLGTLCNPDCLKHACSCPTLWCLSRYDDVFISAAGCGARLLGRQAGR